MALLWTKNIPVVPALRHLGLPHYICIPSASLSFSKMSAMYEPLKYAEPTLPIKADEVRPRPVMGLVALLLEFWL
jgi:hypothetical protein